MTIGFGLALIALIVNALLSSWAIRDLVASNAWVVHTHEVISHLEEMVLTLWEAEVGQRGYIITGQARKETDPSPPLSEANRVGKTGVPSISGETPNSFAEPAEITSSRDSEVARGH